MKLGFVTEYTPEIVEFAGREGFECLELFCEPGTALDLDRMTEVDIDTFVEHMKRNHVQLGTLCCSVNHLHGDPEIRRRNNEYFKKCLRLAKRFGTNIVTTNAWADPAKRPEENMPVFQEVFSDYITVAEKEGVRIGLENCPHFVGYPTPVGNIAFAPGMWRAMFEAVPSDYLGLEFDPSHLYWLGVDYLRALREFAHKVVAVHAKDTEIMVDEIYNWGVIGKQFGRKNDWDLGFYRYRIPGWGSVDWKGIMKVLYDAHFDGPMMIEHEDPVFDGQLRPQGLKMGLKYLRELMIQ